LAILRRPPNGQPGVRDGSLVVLTNLDVLHDLIQKYRKRGLDKAPAVSFDSSSNRTIEDEIARQVPVVVQLLDDDVQPPN